MRGKKSLSFLLSGVIFLFLAPSTFAASIILQSPVSQLQSSTDEYTVSVHLSISASDQTKYYLRGVFFKPGTSGYCGMTWNGSSWFSGPYSSNEGWKNFLPITVMNNSWSGELKAKIDPTNTDCQESGTYSFKVDRFTEAGSKNADPQQELSLAITIPSSTPTSSPTPKPTSTPKPPAPTVTPKPPTVSPTPKPTTPKASPTSPLNPTPTTKSITLTATPQALLASAKASLVPLVSHASSPSVVLGEAASRPLPRPTLSPSPLPTPQTLVFGASRNIIPLFIGTVFLGGCGILSFLIYKKERGA